MNKNKIFKSCIRLIYIVSLFIFVPLYSFAAEVQFSKSQYDKDYLLSNLSKAQKLRDNVISEIRKIDIEIKKNNETIQKSERIITLAQQRSDNNAKQAKLVAEDAIIKAQEAKQKNEEARHFYEKYLNLLENLISNLETLIPSSSYQECNCEELNKKYEGFKKAIKDFTKTAQMDTKEYQEWENELKKAEKESLQILLDNTISFISSKTEQLLNERLEKLEELKRQIDKYYKGLEDEKLVKNKYLFDRLIYKMGKANQHYLQTKDAVETLRKTKKLAYKTTKTKDLISSLEDTIGLLNQEIKKGDTEILDLLKDPEIRDSFENITITLIQYAGEYEEEIRKTDKVLAPMVKRINLFFRGLSLAKDIGYTGLHLELSLDRLIQLGEVGEQNYQAMQALIESKKALEAKLKECRCTYAP